MSRKPTDGKKPFSAVLFDLDGTLTNTLEDIADAMNRALRLHGLPEWETEDYKRLVGNGARVLARRAVREREEMTEPVLRDYQAWYETHNQVKTRPYDGIPELLRALTARGIPVCVLSNKPHEDTLHVLGHFFPEISFAVALGQTERFPLKPDPAGALWIAEQLGIAPADFAYLGDTGVDMTCARAAGMQPVGVLWGFRDRQELLDNGAGRLIARPEELLLEEESPPGERVYDENGRLVGFAKESIFGGRVYYDTEGRQAGYSVGALLGGERFFDKNGIPKGYSVDSVLKGN